MKIAIVASNASTRFGGEAMLPYQIFRKLYERGEDVHLLTHERCRKDLLEHLPKGAESRLHFVPDTLTQKGCSQLGNLIPDSVRAFSSDLAIHWITERYLISALNQLIKEGKVDLVHEPIPVSPKVPSSLCGLQVPVVIGPMNGGMDYPPAFSQRRGGAAAQWYVSLGRYASNWANWVIPGKRQAEMLLVANRRTKDALPLGLGGQVREMVENGVDLPVWDRWREEFGASREDRAGLRFIYIGSLVPCKAVDLLLEAFASLEFQPPATLSIVGDGELRQELEELSQRLGISDRVKFLGQLGRAQVAAELARSDVFTFPSLKDCGGAAVLEAMAMKLPVICARWGGPADYVTEESGILVDPLSHDAYVEGLASAMRRLAASADLRKRLGEHGYVRVEQFFQWDRKIDKLLDLYRELSEA